MSMTPEFEGCDMDHKPASLKDNIRTAFKDHVVLLAEVNRLTKALSESEKKGKALAEALQDLLNNSEGDQRPRDIAEELLSLYAEQRKDEVKNG